MQTSDEVRKALEVVFKAYAAFYKTRGFQRCTGFGNKPALLIIDLANAWTRPGNASTCDNMKEIISCNQKLIEDFRRRGLRWSIPPPPKT